MSEKHRFSRRLLFAIPAGLLATLLVFVVMEYLAYSAKRSAFTFYYDWECICLPDKSVPQRDLGRLTVVRSSPPIQPPRPELDPEFASLVKPQEIPRDPEAVRKLLAEPDRPRNARWILLNGARPEYPADALHRGEAGHAVIEFTITEEGSTERVRVVEQSSAEFGRAARRTVRGWLFIPRHQDGRPVSSETVRLRIEFRTEE